MSNSAAIAAVTATLTKMIQKAVDADTTVSGGEVTARAPDRARLGAPTNQVNLFLYRTSIDAAWRNQDPPGLRPGESGQPPLPLVLTYLITAYGLDDEDILAHRLLGIAMSVLNDKPLLSRHTIGQALPGSGLELQVDRVRITPDPRSQDEISRMWATFSTGYRLSVSYDAAVVLIDNTLPVSAPLPVLMRGRGDTGPVAGGLFGAIELVRPPRPQAAARPGDVLTVIGTNLDAVSTVQVTHPLAAEPLTLTPVSATATQVTVQLPAEPQLPAGVATVTATFVTQLDSPAQGGPVTVTSNAAPLALAPAIVGLAPATFASSQSPAPSLTVTCSPAVQPGQTIALLLDAALVPINPVSEPVTELTFPPQRLIARTYTVRLRVDSVDSIPVVAVPAPASPTEPVAMSFDAKQQLVVS